MHRAERVMQLPTFVIMSDSGQLILSLAWEKTDDDGMMMVAIHTYFFSVWFVFCLIFDACAQCTSTHTHTRTLQTKAENPTEKGRNPY